MGRRVIVCQIGAREHYAVPRLLHRAGLLKALITDVWAPPGGLLRHIPGQMGERLRGRYHPELADALVVHFSHEALARQVRSKMSRQASRWDQIMTHNAWFERRALQALSNYALLDREDDTVLLAYSYAARDLLQAGRINGAVAVLGQIDGGEEDERLISKLSSSRGVPAPTQAPAGYWERWHAECALAQRIIANSDWSKGLLTAAGVEENKIDVVPIAYSREADTGPPERSYPFAFSRLRPLRVLYLGAATLRKGIIETLEAARQLANQPVSFSIVGGDPDQYATGHGLQNVTYYGPVPRERVHAFYAEADVFLFPTHSDGFGMTQIEALAAGLPVIASKHCAALVKNGETGFVLQMVSGAAISGAIETILAAPDRLPAMSKAASQSVLEFTKVAHARLLELASIRRC